MAVLSKHVCEFIDRAKNQQAIIPQSVETVLSTTTPAYDITVTGAGEPCARNEDTEEATYFQAQEASKNDSDIIVIQEEELEVNTSLASDSSSSTPPESQSESDIFRLNRKKTVYLGQKLIRRYKRLLRDTSTLEEGNLQVRTKAFRFIRKSRRGRTEELKALISYFYKIMPLEVKPRGWIRRLLEEMLKLTTKFGISWNQPVNYNSFRLRAIASKMVGDIEKIEESPASVTEEADKGFFNKNLGTWGSWSESEREIVRDRRPSGKTVK